MILGLCGDYFSSSAPCLIGSRGTDDRGFFNDPRRSNNEKWKFPSLFPSPQTGGGMNNTLTGQLHHATSRDQNDRPSQAPMEFPVVRVRYD